MDRLIVHYTDKNDRQTAEFLNAFVVRCRDGFKFGGRTRQGPGIHYRRFARGIFIRSTDWAIPGR